MKVLYMQEAVELSFSERNEVHHMPRQQVMLHLHIKNVPQLLLRVFDINVWAILTATLEQVAVPCLLRSAEFSDCNVCTHLP